MAPDSKVSHLWICTAVVIAAGLWGIFWIPQRYLDQAGLNGGWAIISQYLTCLAILFPVAVFRYLKGRQTGVSLALPGLLLGGGIVCYANSFLLTDVIHTMLLFYLTPLWATLIELAFLKQKPGKWRVVSLPLALAGVWVVLGEVNGLPMPANSGDWLAFAGGAIYAVGAARVQVSRVDGVFPILFAFFLYGSIVAILQAQLLSAELSLDMDVLLGDAKWSVLAPVLIVLCVTFFIPTNAIISWAPTRIKTGLFSILILSEIVVGTASAALWAGESFGVREVLGSLFILTAGVLEVLLDHKSVSGS